MSKRDDKLPPTARREASSPGLPEERKRRLVDHLARPFFIGLLLALVTFAVYWRVVGYGFINYDDPEYFSANYHVQAGLTRQSISWALRTQSLSSRYPLTWLSYLLDAQLFGTGAAGPHFTNFLLHAANSVLLFFLLRRLTGSQWRSAFVAALFALHPLHVETVAWISERKGVLSTFFGFLSLLFYTRHAGPEIRNSKFEIRNYCLSLFFFACGLMSKPILVTLPFGMLLLDYWPLQRVSSFKCQVSSPAPHSMHDAQRSTLDARLLWRLVLEKVPYFVLGLLTCLVTLETHKKALALNTLDVFPISTRIANAFVSYARYLGKMFWPVDLALPYPHPGHWPMGQVLPAVVVVLGLCGAAIGFIRRRPYFFVGWFWFLGMLVPVIGLVQWGGQAMADRFSYLPLIGLFIILTWGGAELLARRSVSKWATVAVAAFILVACAVRTGHQLRYWRNSGTLFSHAIAVTKNNDVAYASLGTYLTEQGRKDEAMENYRKALLCNPKSPDILCNMGTVLADQKQYDEAIADYEAALQLDPDQMEARINLGITLAETGKAQEGLDLLREAVRREPGNPKARNCLGRLLAAQRLYAEADTHFAEAVSLAPNFADAHYQWGLALLAQGKTDEAIAQFESALQADPHFIEIHNDLGRALAAAGRTDEAIEHFRLLLQWEPNHASAHENLAAVLVAKGELAGAVIQFREAVRCRPNDANTHYNLANALALSRDFSEAVGQYTEALRLAPDHVAAHCNLGSALAEMGRREEAIAQFREALRLQPENLVAKQRLEQLLPAGSQSP